MESNATTTTTMSTNTALVIVALCIGLLNSMVWIIIVVWLRRHPKLRGGPDPTDAKPKTGSPKKVLTIDYRMSELIDDSECCPQGQGPFAIGQPAPQEGRGSRTQVHYHGDGRERDNSSFTAAPENLELAPVYENASFPARVT